MNRYYANVVHLDVIKFWKNIFSMSKGMAALLVLGCVLRYGMSISLSWRNFILLVIIDTLLYAGIMYFWCMNVSEKSLCQQAIRKIWR